MVLCSVVDGSIYVMLWMFCVVVMIILFNGVDGFVKWCGWLSLVM